jgi:hypothetical protein
LKSNNNNKNSTNGIEVTMTAKKLNNKPDTILIKERAKRNAV